MSVSTEERTARFNTLAEQDRLADIEFAKEDAERNTEFLTRLHVHTSASVAAWRTDMGMLVINSEDREKLNGFAEELTVACERFEKSRKDWIDREHPVWIRESRDAANSNRNRVARKFLAIAQTIDYLEALIDEKIKMQARSRIEFFAKKNNVCKCVESEFCERIAETIETFTKLFALAIK